MSECVHVTCVSNAGHCCIDDIQGYMTVHVLYMCIDGFIDYSIAVLSVFLEDQAITKRKTKAAAASKQKISNARKKRRDKKRADAAQQHELAQKADSET